MTHLNSVLLEGTVEGIVASDGGAVCGFVLNTNLRSGEVKSPCISMGKLAETMIKTLENGRGVRVVGHLANDRERLVVVVEHVEYKPRKVVKE